MVQMLGLSLGITCASALLHAFNSWFGPGLASAGSAGQLPAFRAAFVAIGLMTIGAAAVFWQLKDDRPVQG